MADAQAESARLSAELAVCLVSIYLRVCVGLLESMNMCMLVSGLHRPRADNGAHLRARLLPVCLCVMHVHMPCTCRAHAVHMLVLVLQLHTNEYKEKLSVF